MHRYFLDKLREEVNAVERELAELREYNKLLQEQLVEIETLLREAHNKGPLSIKEGIAELVRQRDDRTEANNSR